MNLVFILEEPSAKDLLQGLLPRLIPVSTAVHYLIFEGKQDLERQLVKKLRGWRLPDSAFVVLRDQDAAECRAVRKFIPDYQKRDGARRVGGLLDPQRNSSASFRAFCSGVQRLLT